MRRTIFFVKKFRVYSVGITLHRQGPIAKMRQKDWRDPDVVINHLALGEPNFRVENFVQVRNRELFSFNDEFSFFWHWRQTFNAQRSTSNIELQIASRAFVRGAQAASLHSSAACRRFCFWVAHALACWFRRHAETVFPRSPR